MEIVTFRNVPRKGMPVAAPSSNNNAGFANVDISFVLLVSGMDFGPRTRENIWNSIGFGSIGTKSTGNYKVSGRPSKGGAGDRAQVYDTTPTQEVAMPDLQTYIFP